MGVYGQEECGIRSGEEYSVRGEVYKRELKVVNGDE